MVKKEQLGGAKVQGAPTCFQRWLKQTMHEGALGVQLPPCCLHSASTTPLFFLLPLLLLLFVTTNNFSTHFFFFLHFCPACLWRCSPNHFFKKTGAPLFPHLSGKDLHPHPAEVKTSSPRLQFVVVDCDTDDLKGLWDKKEIMEAEEETMSQKSV